jgi:RNA polymerase sigma factor (TIGR02999 family)
MIAKDRFERLSRILAEAVDLPPEERDAFVAAECGDDGELLAEIAERLAREGEVSELPDTARATIEGPPEELVTRVYEQLHRIAEGRMRQERKGHTLQATALVNEAWLRLAGRGEERGFESRSHFYHAAAEAMRRVLIDHARSRGRVKRGGGRKRALVNVLDLAVEPDFEEVTAVDDAIRQLEEKDPRAGRVVRLRFFTGLSVEETAAVLGVSSRTVIGDWAYARAWLFGALGESDERTESS